MLTRTIRLTIGGSILQGDLTIPDEPRGLVLFAHGSGSSRHSPRNRYAAAELQKRNLATCLLDLLTQREEQIDRFTGQLRFDIALLSRRLLSAAEYLKKLREVEHLHLGLFGASTGGAAALIAASTNPELFGAIVSRGGRPDMAEEWLHKVQTPTLFIVGGLDTVVIQMNHFAYRLLRCKKKLEIIPGASHLFEEPGKLEIVASHAAAWFSGHLAQHYHDSAGLNLR